MFGKVIWQSIIYPLLITLCFLFWILMTESGLKTTFWLVKSLLPGNLTTQSLSGSLNNRINLQRLHYDSKDVELEVNEVTLEISLKTLLSNKITLSHFHGKETTLTLKTYRQTPLFIDEVQGSGTFLRNGTPLMLSIPKLQGSWSQLPLAGHIKLDLLNMTVSPPDILLTLGKNRIEVSTASPNPKEIHCLIAIENLYQHSLDLQGFVIAKSNQDWEGSLIKAKMVSPYIGSWTLKEPTLFYFSQDTASIEGLRLIHNTNALATASFLWDKNNLNAKLEIPALPLTHPDIQGKVGLAFEIQKKPKQIPLLEGYCIVYPGSITSPLLKAKYLQFGYRGGAATIKSNAEGLLLQFSLKENNQNAFRGVIKSQPIISFKNFLKEPIQGQLVAKWSDLSLLYAFIPQISKLKTSIDLNGQFKGTWNHPILHLEAQATSGSFFIPKQSLKITDFKSHLAGDIPGNLALSGSARSGEGGLQFTGKVEIYEEKKANIKLSGENIDIYHTPNIHIVATPEITVNIVQSTLYVEGTVRIPYANIFLKDEKNYAMLSKDIIYVDQQAINSAQSFRIVPSLYLLVENNLHFKGYGIDGIIGGKLAIEQRPDGLLSGSGRLTIKEGKYRLQGATRYIHRGYLLFPSGTLLTDPILDIRILQKRPESEQSGDVGIYVQGTLQKPLYQPYSNTNLQSSEIMSRLGFGNSETSGDENQKQLLSQTAFLLAGSANPFIDFLQTNLGLEEFNLEARETQKSFFTQGGTDTVLVIGKSLTPRIYLQYLQSVLEPITTIRLKYFLSRYFTVSTETGTEGLGGDLTFSMERD